MCKVQEKLSWVPLKISLRYNDVPMGIGTAFFYQHGGETFFITNWHNVSGRHFETKKLLNKNAGIPNNLILHSPKLIPKPENASENQFMVSWVQYELPLYKNDRPIWYVHPEYNSDVDLIAIPLGIDRQKTITANAPEHDLEDIILRPSLDVYVLGYPKGFSGGAKLPIWKRGSIASEPDFDLDGLPKIYIDTATREGMSGAPVYSKYSGYYLPEGKPQAEAIIGEIWRFLGVYSGRVGDDPFQAQLGIVWKERAIIETIEGRVIGESSF